MSFLAPQFLWIGLAVSALVAALHFIVTRQPKSEAFPTARFVPDSPVEAVSRATRPTDLLLLLLRLLAIMSIAAAFARPVLSGARQTKARIFLTDVSRTSRNLTEVRDSTRKYFQSGDVIVAFDSTPRVVESADSLLRAQNRSASGNLSAALISAIRSSIQVREKADSISLILVSALPQEMIDPATDTIRSLWPGAIEILRVAPSPATETVSTSPIRGGFAADDPLRYSIELASKASHAAGVRIVRSGPLPAAGGNSDEVLLHWPVVEQPRFAQPTAPAIHGGIVVGKTVVIAPFQSHWEFPPDSMNGAVVMGRWVDGGPAVIQRREGARCIRSSIVPVASRGDLVIRSEFITLVQDLLSSCDPVTDFVPASDAAISSLRGGTAAAARAALPAGPASQSPYALWLFLAAFVFLIAEQFARRAPARSAGRTADTSFRAAA